MTDACNIGAVKQRYGLIIDAVVLIDFLESDATLFRLISDHIGPLYVATTTLDEVEQLDKADCVSLGLVLVEPSLSQLEEAATKVGTLSIEDAITMIFTQKLKEAGELLRIPLLDHVITGNEKYISLKEIGAV